MPVTFADGQNGKCSYRIPVLQAKSRTAAIDCGQQRSCKRTALICRFYIVSHILIVSVKARLERHLIFSGVSIFLQVGIYSINLRAYGKYIREIKNIFFQKQWIEIFFLQSFKRQPFKSVCAMPLVRSKFFSPQQQIGIGYVY